MIESPKDKVCQIRVWLSPGKYAKQKQFMASFLKSMILKTYFSYNPNIDFV